MARYTWIITNIEYSCDDDNGWVSVSPREGNEKNYPQITISKATKPNECSSATVVVSASTGNIQYIPVVRCVPECDCNSIGFTANTIGEISANGGRITLGNYKDCECNDNVKIEVDGILLQNPISGSSVVTATATKNTIEAPRYGWFRIIYNNTECFIGNVIQAMNGENSNQGTTSSESSQ